MKTASSPSGIQPGLEKDVIHLTDGNWANEPRKDIPGEVLQMCDFQKDLWEEGYYRRTNNCAYIRSGIEDVTDYRAVPGKGKEAQWFLEINEKRQRFLAADMEIQEYGNQGG